MHNDTKLLEAVKAVYKAIDDKFGEDIRILDISGISVLSDFFIIATSNNPNQLKAICDEAELALHKSGLRLLHSEGVGAGGWALLDFGTIVVHIFGKEEREYYNLERIWGDAEVVEAKALGV